MSCVRPVGVELRLGLETRDPTVGKQNVKVSPNRNSTNQRTLKWSAGNDWGPGQGAGLGGHKANSHSAVQCSAVQRSQERACGRRPVAACSSEGAPQPRAANPYVRRPVPAASGASGGRLHHQQTVPCGHALKPVGPVTLEMAASAQQIELVAYVKLPIKHPTQCFRLLADRQLLFVAIPASILIHRLKKKKVNWLHSERMHPVVLGFGVGETRCSFLPLGSIASTVSHAKS